MIVALLCSAIPYPLEIVGAAPCCRRRVFGVLVSLEPAIGALGGLLAVLGERLSVLRWLAIGAGGRRLGRRSP